MAKEHDLQDWLNKKPTEILLGFFDKKIEELGNKIRVEGKRKYIAFADLERELVDNGLQLIENYEVDGKWKKKEKILKIPNKKTLIRTLNALKKFGVMDNITQAQSNDNRSWWTVSLDWRGYVKAAWQLQKIQNIRTTKPNRIISLKDLIIYDTPSKNELDSKIINKIKQLEMEFSGTYNKLKELLNQSTRKKLILVWDNVKTSKMDIKQKYILRQYLLNYLPTDVRLLYSAKDRKNNKIPPDLQPPMFYELSKTESRELDALRNKFSSILQAQNDRYHSLFSIFISLLSLSHSNIRMFKDFKDFITLDYIQNKGKPYFQKIHDISSKIKDIGKELEKIPLVLIRPPRNLDKSFLTPELRKLKGNLAVDLAALEMDYEWEF